MCVSVPLVLEYESALKRFLPFQDLRLSDAETYLDFIAKSSEHHGIHYSWRPVLRDPDDDMVLELAANCSADYIITYNVRDFIGADRFGVSVATPREFLDSIGETV